MSDLVEFLRARLDEDVLWIQHFGAVGANWITANGKDQLQVTDARRLRREVEAKRRIVAEHSPVDPCDAHDGATLETIPCDTVRALAAVYDYHPDYREEWR